MTNLMAGALSLILVAVFLAFGAPVTPAQGLALAWLCAPLGLSLLPRFTGRLHLCQTAAIVNLAGLITFLTAISGGPRSFLMAWFLVIPMEAAVHRRRPLIVMGVGLSAAGLLILAGLDVAGLLPTPAVPLEGVPLLYALGAAGAVVYAAGLALSIQSQYEESEHVARDGESRYRLLADHAVDLITRHRADGTIVFASPAARSLLGRPPETLKSQSPATLAHDDDRAHVRLAFMRASYLAEETAVEYRMARADGNWVWVETRCRPAPGPLQKFGSKAGREVIAVTRDITPRKTGEALIIAARDEAEAASRAKSRFLANMSHELRTPLNAIIGFSDMMLAELFGPLGAPKYREYAAHIHASGRLLLDLINDVLDMAKIEAGKRDLNMQWIDLPGVAKEVLNVVGPLADQRSLSLTTHVQNGMTPVWADRRSLKQILLNLLSNAIKFTPPGGRVSVHLARTGEAVRLIVKDTGIGIPEDEIGRLGKPFEQVEGDYVRGHEGTGLGLALVRSLTELHGGRFAIQSAPGQGTEVIVTLPQTIPAEGTASRLRGAA